MKKSIGIFASGGKESGDGGSGAKKILEQVLAGEIEVQNILLFSHHPRGGVYELEGKYKADLDKKGITLKFQHIGNIPRKKIDEEYTPDQKVEITEIYEKILRENNLNFMFLSGWLKQVLGILPHMCINIHPGPIKHPYGGRGKYGMKVHNQIWDDYKKGKINCSCVTMHYVVDGIDEGPMIAQIPVDISSCNSAEEVQTAVQKVEQQWQWKITKMIIDGEISWSGNKEDPIRFPEGFMWNQQVDITKEQSFP